MMRQQLYYVIEADDVKTLARLVNEAMYLGWMPTGGVAAVRYIVPPSSHIERIEWRFYQAMTRLPMPIIDSALGTAYAPNPTI